MELIQAVAEGDSQRIEALVHGTKKSELNKRGSNRTTALMIAAIRGNARAVRTLIDAGAKLDLKDADCQTALTHAICQQNDDVVNVLLDAGARPDVEHWLAFDFAVRFGKPALVQRLIELGADVNYRQDHDDPTPLMDAISRGNTEIVDMLLDAGADPSAIAQGGQTALSVAAEHGNQPVFERLIDVGCPLDPALAGAVSARNLPMVRTLIELGANVNAVGDEFRYSLLSTAVSHGDAKMVRLLLKAGADVESRDWMGQTPLWTAATYGRARIARILLDAGANLDVRDDNGSTLLEEVASMGQEKVMELFLKRGADPNRSNDRSRAPLFWAVAIGSTAMTKALLNAGADPNAVMPKRKQIGVFEGCPPGTTPLMIAARDGKVDLIDLLLASGADPNVKNSKGWAAADFAAKRGHTGVLDRLTAAGAEVNWKRKSLQNAILIRSVEVGDLPAVESALAAGAQPEATEKQNGTTPLMRAALDGHTEIVRALLDAGADPDRVSKWGENALRHAVVRGRTEIVRILLASGANPNVQYAAGSVPSGQRNTVITSLESPLCDAAYQGLDEIVDLLIDAGADVNSTSDSGVGPLLAAVYGRKHDSARRLLDAGARPRPEDADYVAVLDWQRVAREPDFTKTVDDVAAACGTKPQPVDWLPGARSFQLVIPDRGDGGGDDAADRTEAVLAWSKQFTEDYTDLAKQIDAVLNELADRIAKGGFHLIDAGMPLGCGPVSRFLVLLPTRDKYAILAAFGVNGNDMELSNRDIIQWFRELETEIPFGLRGCKFDTVSIELAAPFAEPKRWAKKLCAFCPDSYDSGEIDLLIEQLRTTTKLNFWWD